MDNNVSRVTKDIFVLPGMKDGMTMRFKGEGNLSD